MAIATKKKMEDSKKQHPSIDKYDKIHRDLMNYILSGESHSTLVGMTISMDHSDEGVSEVETYVEYIVSQLRRAEEFSKRNI